MRQYIFHKINRKKKEKEPQSKTNSPPPVEIICFCYDLPPPPFVLECSRPRQASVIPLPSWGYFSFWEAIFVAEIWPHNPGPKKAMRGPCWPSNRPRPVPPRCNGVPRTTGWPSPG